MRPSALRALAGLVLTASVACTPPGEPRLVLTPPSGTRAGTHIDAIDDYPSAVAAITTIFERDLDLPHVPVTVRLYSTGEAFEAGLVELGHDPVLARAAAVGGHRVVLLNQRAVTRLEWPQLTRLLARALTHSVLYDLGGGVRGTSDQWLRDGFAEWVSSRVLDRLDAMSFAAFRRQLQFGLHRTARARVPSLGELVTFRQWVDIAADRRPAAYLVTFFAVEALIEEHGVEAVLDYFSRFATSADRVANFQAAFGEDLETFEAALAERLWPR